MSRHNPPDIAQLIERAERGDRTALWRLYGMAGAWLRKGTAPPAPLDGWIAQRLDDLAALLRQSAEKDSKRQLRDQVLRVIQPAKPGRPARRSTALKTTALATDVRAVQSNNRISGAKAAELVSRRRAVSPKTAEASVRKRTRR
jgi:hypothetical protein